MTRHIIPVALALTLCLAVSFAYGEPRGKEGEKSRGNRSSGGNQAERKSEGKQNQGARGEKLGGNKTPGGEWSERTHGGKQSSGQLGNRHEETTTAGAAAGSAVGKNKTSQATGAQGAAAGAAVSNRNSSQVSGAQGAAAGAAAANRNSSQVSGATGAAAGYAAVRNSFNHSNIYGQQWYGAHPGVWRSSGFAAGAVWIPSTWGVIAGHCGYGNVPPISYNYGVNVTCQDGNVLLDGQNVGTTDEFSQQAADLAEMGSEAETSDTDQWLPLGVFAMVRNEHQHPQLVLQLAINQQGILRGNYTDEITDNTLPIRGAADKTTQRAAWTVGGNMRTVMEAGLNDLTDAEAPALIHKNGKTDHWLLIRLDQPK